MRYYTDGKTEVCSGSWGFALKKALGFQQYGVPIIFEPHCYWFAKSAFLDLMFFLSLLKWRLISFFPTVWILLSFVVVRA